MNIELEKIVENYKNSGTQENYNILIMKLFTNIEQKLILPSIVRKDNNGFDLKSIYDFQGNSYLVAYTSDRYVNKNDETFLINTLKGIIEIVLNNKNCFGLIINPDKDINEKNREKQCIIPKEYIINLFKI